EPDRQPWVLIVAPQGRPQVMNIISREATTSPDSQVAREVDEQPEQRATGRPGREDADVGIDRAGGLPNRTIALTGMGNLAPITHQEPAIEADAGFVADSIAQFGSV